MSTCSQDLWREFLLPVDPVDRFQMQLVGIMRLAEEVVERGSVVLPINNIGRSLMQSSQ